MIDRQQTEQHTSVRSESTERTWRIHADLLLLIGFCIATGMLIYVAPNSPLRVPAGMLFVFFAPGYALLAALYPKQGPLGQAQRLFASLGASVVISGLVLLAITYSLGTTLLHSFGAIGLWIFTMVLIAGYRRHLASAAERFVPRLRVRLPSWNDQGLSSKWLTLAQLLALLVLCLALVRLLWVSSQTGPQFTEFYLLGPEGIAGRYPEETVAGEPVNLILGVVNHEQGDTQYRIERVHGAGREEVARFHLSHEQIWEQPQTFTLMEPGENQEVEFLLYKGDEEEPYRSLHLWITVREE